MTHDDMDDGAPIYLPEPDTDPVVEAIAETLDTHGARLCDGPFFEKAIGPLFARFGIAAVMMALRRHHALLRRRVASQIGQQQQHATRLKRELRAEGLQP
jgi:hypothetical protein